MLQYREIFLCLILPMFIFQQMIFSQNQIPYEVISNGIEKQTNNEFILWGTVGQTSVEKSSSSSYQSQAGFWYVYVFIPFLYSDSLLVSAIYNFDDATKTSSYKMIGIPGQNNLKISDIISGTPGKDGDWRAFWDQGSGNYTEFDGSNIFYFIPGKAFWVVSKNPITLNQKIKTVTLSADYTFPIQIHKGWNLISNPFEKPILWSEVQSSNPGVNQPIFNYHSGSYVNPNPVQLEPYKGYYFHLDSNSTLTQLKLPYLSGSGGSLSKLSVPITNELELVLAFEGDRKSSVKIGFCDQSNAGLDELDIFSPPSQFCEINLALYNKDFDIGYKFLQEEYRRQIGEGQEYDLLIKNSSEKTLDLISNGLDNLSEYEVYLMDKKLRKFYDFKKQKHIDIKSSKYEKEYKLLIGKQEYILEKKNSILPTEYFLYQNFPNPFNPTTTIMFEVPQQSTVTLSVHNILGELINVLANNQLFEAGYHEIEFDGSSLASGMYLYNIIANNYITTKKMLLLK